MVRQLGGPLEAIYIFIRPNFGDFAPLITDVDRVSPWKGLSLGYLMYFGGPWCIILLFVGGCL